jgi:hypothetical protein
VCSTSGFYILQSSIHLVRDLTRGLDEKYTSQVGLDIKKSYFFLANGDATILSTGSPQKSELKPSSRLKPGGAIAMHRPAERYVTSQFKRPMSMELSASYTVRVHQTKVLASQVCHLIHADARGELSS